MKISEVTARKLLRPLYNVAEKDKNDVIANAASALAVRFEFPKRVYVLSDLDQRIIRHALYSQPDTEMPAVPRRKTYKRRVSLAGC